MTRIHRLRRSAAAALAALAVAGCAATYANGKPQATCDDAYCRWDASLGRCDCRPVDPSGFWSSLGEILAPFAKGPAEGPEGPQ